MTKSVPRIRPAYHLETAMMLSGARNVAGVDEVGRGPLAGPVVAAAVILDFRRIPKGLDDSKKLSARTRERLFDEILAVAAVSVASVPARRIDETNIRIATLSAMASAVSGLPIPPCRILVDGNDVPADFADKGTCVVKGDAVSSSIAAASIVAKVIRDRMMTKLCAIHPAYGFSRNAGYGTKEHLEAIERHGPVSVHRISFAPLKNLAFSLGSDVHTGYRIRTVP